MNSVSRAAGRALSSGGSLASGGTTPDLIGELAELARMAKQAQLDLAAGMAVTGTTALRRIELRARDAITHSNRTPS